MLIFNSKAAVKRRGFRPKISDEGEFKPEVLKTIADKNGGYYRKGDPKTISTVMGDLQLEF